MGPGGKICFVAVLLHWSVLYVRGSTDIDAKVESVVQEEHTADRGLPKISKAGSSFDYYVFAQQWPGTFCRKSGACCQNVAKPVKFTVHGLWPENEDNSYPSCCSGPGFDEEKIEELYTYLVKNWPTLSCNSPKQCRGKYSGKFGFWKHEWEKHGTCSYPLIPDEGTYFSVGLNLHQKYDISKILSDAGFVPGNKKYQTSEMKEAVADAVGGLPAFSCKGQLIDEIWVCLTKDLKVRDCGMPAKSCGKYTQIPPFRGSVDSEDDSDDSENSRDSGDSDNLSDL